MGMCGDIAHVEMRNGWIAPSRRRGGREEDHRRTFDGPSLQGGSPFHRTLLFQAILACPR